MRAMVLLAVGSLGGCGAPQTAAFHCAIRPGDFRPISSPLAPGSAIPVEMLINRIDVDRAGRLTWNGTGLAPRNDPNGWATLETYLEQSAILEPVPAATIVYSRGAPCEAVERVRAAMRRHLACRSSWKCLQGDPSP